MVSTLLPIDAVAESADTGHLVKGTGVTLAGKLFASPVRFLTQVILARALGPDSFGLFTIGWTLTSFSQVVAPAGLDRGVIRFATPHYTSSDRDFRGVTGTAFLLALGLSLLQTVLLCLAAPWIAAALFQKAALAPVLQWFALLFPLTAFLAVGAAVTRISLRMAYSAVVADVVYPAVQLLATILLLTLGGDLNGAILAVALASLCAALLLSAFLIRLFPHLLAGPVFLLQSVRPLLAFSIPAGLIGFLYMLITRMDRFVLGALRPESEVGIFQAAALFPLIIEMGLASISTAMLPMIADLDSREDRDRLQALFRTATKWGMYAATPLVLVLCIAPRETLAVFFGDAYADGWTALLILTLAQYVNISTGAIGPLLVMTGRNRPWLRICILSVILDLSLLLALVPPLGMAGAALSTAVSVSVMFLIGVLEVRRSLGFWPYDRRFLKGLAALAVTFVALYGIRQVVEFPPLGLLLILTVAASAIFLTALFLLRLDPEDRALLDRLWTRKADR